MQGNIDLGAPIQGIRNSLQHVVIKLGTLYSKSVKVFLKVIINGKDIAASKSFDKVPLP
jgi:hypothetical protein